MDNQFSPAAFRLLLVTGAVVAGCTDLSVSVIPVARIEVVPASVSLETGESVELRATPTDAAGNSLPERGVEWHIGDPSKAIVSSGGVVYALESGVTIAEARSEGAVGMANIRVVSPKPEPPDRGEEGGDGDPKDSGENDTDDDRSGNGDNNDGGDDGGGSSDSDDDDGDGDDGDGDDDGGDDDDGDDDDGDDDDGDDREGKNGKEKGGKGKGKGDERGGKKK